MKVTPVLALAGAALAVPTEKRATALTYASWSSPNGISYNVAIPAASAAPFDVALKIVAPKAVGWAGIAWGGSMLNNPLTIAWANGEDVTVSSRLATGYMLPQAYAGLEFTKGPENKANATHWTLDVICKGCSKWAAGSLNPAAATAPMAWAFSAKAPPTPASNTSTFGYHDNKGRFTLPLASGVNADFGAPAAQ